MLNTVAVGVTNLLLTIAAMFFIDRLGRKTLLLIGAVGMFFSLSGAAMNFYSNTSGGIGILICIVGFIASFAFSQGAVIWVFLSEIFPNKVRSKGQALGSFTHWIMNALIAWTFPTVLTRLGGGNAFMFFAVMMIPFFIFVWKMLPETKGRSLEDLEKFILSKP
jgi:MFS family permease